MPAINALTNAAADALLRPFAGASPAWLLTTISALTGFAMMIVFRFTSPQNALRRASDRTRAALLAMKLFRDEPAVMLTSQAELLKATALRLLCSLPPLLVLLVPTVLLLVQLAARFEHRPLRPGEYTIVRLALAPDAWNRADDVRLHCPPGLRPATPPLRLADEHILLWRIHAEQPGNYTLAWSLDGQRVEKRLTAAGGLVPISPRRPNASFWQSLLYPLEPPLPPGAFARQIDIDYPSRSTPLLGLDVHWLITFFVVAMLAALLVKPFLRVHL